MKKERGLNEAWLVSEAVVDAETDRGKSGRIKIPHEMYLELLNLRD